MFVCVVCVSVCVIKLDSPRQRIDEDMQEREASQDRRHIRERWEDGYERESASSQLCPLLFYMPHTRATPPVLVLFSRAVSFKNAIET